MASCRNPHISVFLQTGFLSQMLLPLQRIFTDGAFNFRLFYGYKTNI